MTTVLSAITLAHVQITARLVAGVALTVAGVVLDSAGLRRALFWSRSILASRLARNKLNAMSGTRPSVVIVGAGFGGIEAAKALRRAPVDVTLIDRQNHHCFQPLLYQVATAALSPADIAWPIRHILRGQDNATVLMAEVVGVDTARAPRPAQRRRTDRLRLSRRRHRRDPFLFRP